MTKHFYSYLLGAILTAMLSVSGYAKEHNNYDHITKTFAKANNTDLSNVVKLSNYKFTREGGGEVTSASGTSETANMVFLYTFDWDLSSLGGNVKAGDHFIVPLADNILPTFTQSTNLVVNNVVIGSVSTNRETGLVQVVFNENVEGLANSHGTISFPVSVPLKEGDNIITMPDGTTKKIIYTKNEPSKPGEVLKEIVGKQGMSIYADYIEWSVYINRSSQDFGTSEVIVEDEVRTSSGSFVSLLYNQYMWVGINRHFELREATYSDPTNANTYNVSYKNAPRTYTFANGTTMTVNNSIIVVTTDKEEYDAEIAKGNQDIAYAEILNGGQKFRLHLGNKVGTRSFILKYRTNLPTDNSQVLNKAGILVDNKATLPYESKNGQEPTGTTIEETAHIFRNLSTITYADTKDRITITKYDAESGVRLAGATFRLTYPDGTTSVELTTGANGTVQTGVLDAGTYTLTEITAPEGYALLKTPTKVEVVYNEATFVNIPNYQIGKEPAPTFCLIEPNTSDSTILNTDFGITTLGRAANSLEDKETWPLSRKGGWMVLESNTKPFVVTRTTSDKITNPENGMLIFDTTDKCLKLYDGTKWTCFSTPACPTK